MTRLFSTFLSILFVLALAVATLPATYACDGCEHINTGGDVWINTDQYLELLTDIPGCGNYVATTDLGEQGIWGGGVGDELTKVSAKAYLGQEGPYDTGEITVPNGTISQTGDSVMELTVGAGTDAFCHTFDLELLANRESNTYNEIGQDHMNSSLCSCADFSADISGAPGTLSWGVNIHDIDAYNAEATNGRLQTGYTEIKISGGSFD